MNILILGSGGREHALAWKIAQSPLLDQLFIAPGNAGTSRHGINLPVSVKDFPAIGEAVLAHHINMVLVGPEDPLVNGIHDYFLSSGQLSHIPVIGPVASAARLEGSKDFAKQFMNRYNIPTARHRTFTPETLTDGLVYLKTLKPPFVLKADGLAAGKGVIICPTLSEAREELSLLLTHQRFGNASARVVIEEYLKGIELSVFILTDGNSYLLLPEAKDYKKIGESDTGPNTGGMGSVSPVPFADDVFREKIIRRIIEPTLAGLKNENIDYKGFLFFGLMNVEEDPYVIEYNCRLGDPESESVIPRINSDLLPLLKAVADRTLHNETIEVTDACAATVMLVSAGYPGDYQKHKEIAGLEVLTESLCFHAGTIHDPETRKVLTNGGRVIALTALAPDMQQALDICYRSATMVDYEGKHYRGDIGFDLC